MDTPILAARLRAADTPVFHEALAAADEEVAATVRGLIATGHLAYEAPVDTESEGAYLAGECSA